MKLHISFLLCALLFLSLASTNAKACGWFYTISIHGQKVTKEHGNNLYLKRSFDKKFTLDKLKELERSLLINYNYQEHSDYAMLLSRISKVKEALKILERLNEEHPEEYILMANLGTLYELNGKLDEALYWIKKAIKKNPDSHHRSEWVHVKILEAKINIRENPNWLKQNHILDIDFSKYNGKPLRPEKLKELEKLERHIAYQLEERIPYTPNPNPIVFQLLMDFAELAKLDDLYSSQMAYHFALLFIEDSKKKNKIETEIIRLDKLILKYNKKPKDRDLDIFKEKRLEIDDYKVMNFFPKEERKKVLESYNKAKNTTKSKDSTLLWYMLFSLIGVVLIISGLKFRKNN